VIDRLLVSHRFVIIRYVDFLQGISGLKRHDFYRILFSYQWFDCGCYL